MNGVETGTAFLKRDVNESKAGAEVFFAAGIAGLHAAVTSSKIQSGSGMIFV